MPKPLLNLLLALAVAGASACAGYGSVREPSSSSGPLVPSLQVETFRDSVRFVYQVTNAGPAPVELTFFSGQSFDVRVLEEGRELWRWSGDRMFTQAIRTETLPPGGTLSYTASWSPPAGVRGGLAAHAYLTAQEHRAEQQASFQLP